MSFLIWHKRADAKAAIDKINAAYGCPYEGDNGYRMDTWCEVTRSATTVEWGFCKPEPRLGRSVDLIMSGVAKNYTEVADRPDYWVIDETT